MKRRSWSLVPPAGPVIVLAMSLLAGCRDNTSMEPAAAILRSPDIIDASHGAAASGFYFLPPLVKQPASTGRFDPSQTAVVEVCRPLGVGCAYPLEASLPASVDRVDETYKANWSTRSADASPIHRVRVRVGSTVLGWADVYLVSNGSQAKSVDGSRYVAVQRGSTVPVKFRIEDGALAAAQAPQLDVQRAASAVIDRAGGTVTATASDGTRFVLQIPENALTDPVTIRLTPVQRLAGVPSTGGLAAGVQFEPEGLHFSKMATLTVQFTAAVEPWNLTGFAYAGTGTSFQVDPALSATNTSITIPIFHFSGAGAGSGSALQQNCTGSKYDCIEEDVMVELAQAVSAVIHAQMHGRTGDAAPILAVLRLWAGAIESELFDAQSGNAVAVTNALNRVGRWTALMYQWDSTGDLLPSYAAIRAAMAATFRAQIDRLDLTCRSEGNLTHRMLANQYAAGAQGLGLDLGSPYTPAEVDVWHCGTIVIEKIDLKDPLKRNQASPLTIDAGISYAGMAPTKQHPLKFTITLTGTTSDGEQTIINPGNVSLSVTPSRTSNSVSAGVNVCMYVPGSNFVNGKCTSDARSVSVAQEIIVEVSPKTATVRRGGTVQFGATVRNATNPAVTWSATGGSISGAGLFTAAVPGPAVVIARSVEDPTKMDSAKVTVTTGRLVLHALTCHVESAVWGGTYGPSYSNNGPSSNWGACDKSAATSSISGSVSGQFGGASSTSSATASGQASFDAQGGITAISLNASASTTLSAFGNSDCDRMLCGQANGAARGLAYAAMQAVDGPVRLRITVTGNAICGHSRFHDEWLGFDKCGAQQMTWEVTLREGEPLTWTGDTRASYAVSVWEKNSSANASPTASWGAIFEVMP